MSQQDERHYWPTAKGIISVAHVKSDKHRKAKPTPADVVAAQRLRALWDAAKGKRPTQEEMATEYWHTDATQGLISLYLNGKIPINYRAVLNFAKALRCNPEDIRSDLPEMRTKTAKLELRGDRDNLTVQKIEARLQWPFAKELKARFDRLTDRQRQSVEEVLERTIAGHEPDRAAPPRKRSNG